METIRKEKLIITGTNYSTNKSEMTRGKISGKEKKQTINFINTNRPQKAMSSLQPGHLPSDHIHSMSQSQSQVMQMRSHENYMKITRKSIQHNSMSCISTAQQNMMKSMQPGSNLNPEYENGMNCLQQVPVNPLQPNSDSVPQPPSGNSLSSQDGVNVIQPNLNPLQPGSSMLQHQQVKQQ
ncbi:unnamed protein product [Lupinus luteus]|uniref:Uncharacterized protein n=1 Tax=Lupinus luteus TaxID=3873 RepID=A0AAV1W5J5_LUPLU